MRVFKTDLQVRGYELDAYNHVNNAVYLNYAELARWKMIEEAAGGQDYFKRNGVAPVLVRTEIDFKEPCFLAEWLVLETTMLNCRTRVARFQHLVKKRDSGRVAAEIIATVLVVNAEGKSVSLPADFERVMG
jgi:acyl-CoA thioester hydrolase